MTKAMPRETDTRPAQQWIPRTQLGKEVAGGKYTSVEQILKKGDTILEPEIVDYLIPDIKYEIVYIGGSPGKGGGIKRTATKRTARMHKSGRRFKLTAMVIAGNCAGIVGLGMSSSKEHRIALEKASVQAKLNIIRVRTGCGSWECGCGGNRSPYDRATFRESQRRDGRIRPRRISVYRYGRRRFRERSRKSGAKP